MLHFIPKLVRMPRLFQHPLQARSVLHHKHFERVLGTVLELQIRASSLEVAYRAETALLFEIDRLERVFSRFLSHSELVRWQCSEGEQKVSLELGELLAESLVWQARTGGAFHPSVDALTQVWKEAEQTGLVPSSVQLKPVLEALKTPLYQVNDTARAANRLSKLPLNFNAIAKGRIADVACGAAFAVSGVLEVLVNLGGDLRHRVSPTVSPAKQNSGLEVDIENPFSSADNAPPIARVRVQNAAVATSGGTRRGFQVGGKWFSHVLDPRTGLPAQHMACATVLADDCATADVLATAFLVLEPSESLELADSLPRVGCLLVSQNARIHSNAFWRAATGTTPSISPSSSSSNF